MLAFFIAYDILTFCSHGHPSLPQLKSGFLLSQHSFDINKQAHIQLWACTDDGPVLLNIAEQKPLFFVKNTDLAALQSLLLRLPHKVEYKPLDLTTFDHGQVTACYFTSLQAAFKAQQLVNASAIKIFEADIRLHERFLMERFIHAGITFSGHLKAQWDSSLWLRKERRQSERENGLRQLCRQANVYKFILLHY